MKKLIVLLIACLALPFVFTSCEKDESFEESLLIGRWISNTLHYKYAADYTGSTWDTADDVTEAEAQPFTWSLEKSDLTHIHIMEVGGNVPKHYTVTELTETTLKYHDDFNVNFSFTKEN